MTSNNTALITPIEEIRDTIAALPAQQQPDWGDDKLSDAIVSLEESAPLVTEAEILDFRSRLQEVAEGRSIILQAGDCAEPMTDTSPNVVEQKVLALDIMGQLLTYTTGLPVLRIGRIAGQFAKPRSQTHETVSGSLIPTYRGALVNDPYPSARAREHESERLVRARVAAEQVTEHLRSRTAQQIWTSHEALVLDYELPQVRPTSDGRAMLTSAHTVWIGARTNQVDHAHVALAAAVINPVGCKVAATTTPEELVELVEAINPERESEKLMLIARMGTAIDKLPELMEAVQRQGQPVIWLCDPMHANTVTAADGRKTRYVEDIRHELVRFQEISQAAGVIVGGVHLETTIDDVRECLVNEEETRYGNDPYTTLCDPRLTVRQALDVLKHWQIGA
ncbi:3-deoxy-7-phosphoheptulonate synthase [Pseudarthrobacter sp. NamE5]|uniref:3-deoxy-7-phosphoheptulonate synthase n=1 Tax=Pseudarthrobacter sp. NamE5 TaxID=2576839 RepID=UPI00110A3029|nr:3-deoxy-7-phosphoheptulonate synthase [Pseudarthrobacter sp. NamE5]TLM80926.1 3-deoxy-7-phosphoheptulonate synthase [Pseudarthrobacter sp. NamE5]